MILKRRQNYLTAFLLNSVSKLTPVNFPPTFGKNGQVISTVTFAGDDIATLIQSLDPDKAHSHDMLSIRM